MTEKDLISKLNNLKNISPDETWLTSNRELLLSQVSNSGAKEISAWQNFVIVLSSLAKASTQPVYAFGIFVFVLLATGIFSHQLFSSAKPNDALYIARVISERAKLSTMINTESRDKLAVQFANGRAQDISAVLTDPNFNNDENKDEIAKLNSSFNEEIATLKTKIKNLTPEKNSVAVSNDHKKIDSGGDVISIAENGRDNKGVQVFENPKIVKESVATLTGETKATSTIKEEKENSVSADTILDEAQKLSDNKDIKKAAEKLNEAVNEIIK